MKHLLALTLILAVCVLGGCQKTYYAAMEKAGYHKRDIMVSRVEKARDAQQDAKEQFQSALERFTALTSFNGGELEERYNKLNADYERSVSRAEAVRERIDAVEDVAEALFDEWETEIGQYSSASLRQSSQDKLVRTRQQYQRMIEAMRRAESRIEPVLAAFRDQVLFLKHNLNAQALASLHSELTAVETDVTTLVREMEKSIAEADLFIANMGSS